MDTIKLSMIEKINSNYALNKYALDYSDINYIIRKLYNEYYFEIQYINEEEYIDINIEHILINNEIMPYYKESIKNIPYGVKPTYAIFSSDCDNDGFSFYTEDAQEYISQCKNLFEETVLNYMFEYIYKEMWQEDEDLANTLHTVYNMQNTDVDDKVEILSQFSYLYCKKISQKVKVMCYILKLSELKGE